MNWNISKVRVQKITRNEQFQIKIPLKNSFDKYKSFKYYRTKYKMFELMNNK